VLPRNAAFPEADAKQNRRGAHNSAGPISCFHKTDIVLSICDAQTIRSNVGNLCGLRAFSFGEHQCKH
jgi:hypothetical protein